MQERLSSAEFGALPDGRAARLYTLTNRNGLVVKITDFGGIIAEIHTPDRDGRFADIALGYDNVAPYLNDSPYFGALIGRYGNRIAKGCFDLDGQTWQLDVNDGENHLHGGERGFHKVFWNASAFETDTSAGVRLSYLSKDGEQGYPGNLDVTVAYELGDDDILSVRFHARTDKATPVNLTQHTYFNLAGEGDVLGHELAIAAKAYTPIDAELIPTGELAPVEGTPFDFRRAHPIGEYIGRDDEQLRHGSGYDHNFVLDKPKAGELALAARARDPRSGRVLELFTEEPGVQFYSGNFLDGTLSGKGWTYAYRSGFCLEPQHFPDSPNQPQFPNTILRPGEDYATMSCYRFSVE